MGVIIVKIRYVLGIGILLATLLLSVQTSWAEKVFVINSSYSAPLSTVQRDGFFDLLLKEAFARLGKDAVTQKRAAERSLVDANEGFADGDVGRVEGIDLVFTNLVRVPEPVLDERSFVAFSIKGKTDCRASWEDLGDYTVGYVHGWKIFDLNTYSAKKRVPVVTTKHLFQLLEAEAIDIALSARLDGLAMAKELEIKDIQVLEPALAKKKMYLYLNKQHTELVVPLADIIKEMKASGRYDELMQSVEKKYFPIIKQAR